MTLLRNVFALIGLLAVVAAGILYVKAQDVLSGLDPKAGQVYLELARRVVETRNAAEATIRRIPVREGLSWQDVEQSMKFAANEHDMPSLWELPLHREVEARSGQPYRFVKVYLFCDPLTAASMMDYRDAYSAYLPWRVTLLEDREGRLWLIAPDMDLMIHGGAPLPTELKAEALRVRETILDIMSRGAAGAF